MRYCKKCGGELSGEARCPYCGKLVEDGKSKEMKTDIEFPKLSALASVAEQLLEYIAVTGDVSLEAQKVLIKAAVKIYNGIDIPKDEAGAKKIFEALALLGNAEAMFWLGQICYRGVIPDLVNAKRWFEKAAKEGHIRAKNMLEWLQGGSVESEKPQAPLPKDIPSDFVGIVKEALPSTLKIATDISGGAGFIIEGGYVVTNHHVIEGARCFGAIFADDESDRQYPLELLASEKKYDVAILKFKGEMAGVVKQESAEGKRKLFSLREDCGKFGETVYTVGNPLGIGISVSKGTISNPHAKWKLHDIKDVIQTDMSINHGNSGGALLDCNNNVLGIVSASRGIQVEGVLRRRGSPLPEEFLEELERIVGGTIIAAGGMSFAVPAEYVSKVLKKIKN